MGKLKWFGVILVVGVIALFFYFKERSTPAPAVVNSAYPTPSFQGGLPKSKVLGAAIKSDSDVPILMYHHIQDPAPSANQEEKNLSLPPAKFKVEINFLAASNYQVITLDELFNESPGKKVVITIDDGYQDAITNALPILKEHGFRAVIFIIVDSVGKPGYLTWDEIKILKTEGWQIGSHSLTHPDFRKLSEVEARKQLVESKNILEEKLNEKINFFCYPSGKNTIQTQNLVREAGYHGAVGTDFGIKNIISDLYLLKRVRINNNETISSFINTLNI